MRYLLATGLVLGLLGLGWTGQAQAECKVLSSSPSYTAGQLKDLTCGTNGVLSVGGGVGSATASAPTFTEGSAGYLSFDLAGNARVTLGTELHGEDATNDLIMTSGGVTRLTTFATVAAAATSSSVTGSVMTGPKKYVAAIAAGTSESTAFDLTIYGNWTNSTTGGFPICRLWINAVTTAVIQQERCETTNDNYMYHYYTTAAGAVGYTSTSGKLITVYAQY